MNEKKCKALKVLGFNYIARDMNGRLVAWMNRTVRRINCLEEYEEKVKEKYGLETSVGYDYIEEDELDEWTDGIHINMSSFQCSEDDDKDIKMWSYGHFELLEENNEWDDITWENSPYKI